MGEQLKNLKCIKQRIISGFFRTINNEFHGFRFMIKTMVKLYHKLFQKRRCRMDNNEKFGLWKFEPVYQYNDNTELIMNQISGQLMIKKTMSDSEYRVHKALCNISDKNIICIYDAVSDSGVCTVIEQFISGVTLKNFCERARPDDEIIIEIALQLCRGLSVLHNNNIVHRDITPTNIMIDDYGIVKIIDFDISRIPDEKARRDTHILGTQVYAAPEQFGFGQSTFRTDIYSVGVILNYMKTGKTPDEKILSDTSILPNIIKKCTAFEPKNRYQSIEELTADLYRYRDAAGVGTGSCKIVLWLLKQRRRQQFSLIKT